MPRFDSIDEAIEFVEERLEDEAAFLQRDEHDLWICPYCMRTQDDLQFTDKLTLLLMDGPRKMAEHLMELCEPFIRAREIPAIFEVEVETDDPDAVQRARITRRTRLLLANEGEEDSETAAAEPTPDRHPEPVNWSRKETVDAQKLVPLVRRRLQEDELFRQRDERNRWFCPFCCKDIASIVLPDELHLAIQDTSFYIADHLANECVAYRADAQPSGRRLALAESEADLRTSQLIAALDEARKRQRHMLPKNVPEMNGVEFECFYQPCDVISGDFYDLVRRGPDEIGIVVGDVSGHGIEAAIVMAMVKKLVQVHGRGRTSAAEVLSVTNQDIADDVSDGVFISVFYGILNVADSTLTCASAGHPPSIIYHASGAEPTRVSPRGLALGLDRGPRFNRLIEEWTVEVEPDDFLFVYTDGLIERADAEGEELGIDRLADLICKYGDRRPHDAVRQIVAGVEKFANGCEPDDDVTLVSCRIRGASSP